MYDGSCSMCLSVYYHTICYIPLLLVQTAIVAKGMKSSSSKTEREAGATGKREERDKCIYTVTTLRTDQQGTEWQSVM